MARHWPARGARSPRAGTPGAADDHPSDHEGNSAPEAAGPPSLASIFVAFFKIGLMAYGGGSATVLLMQRACRRGGWLTDAEFFDTLTLSRLTPGVTILAQVLIIGKRARGFDGAAAAMTGMLIPSLAATILVARGYELVSGWPRAAEPLGALAAVAAGLALGLSTQMLRETFRRLGPRTAGLSFVLYLALTFAVRDNALIVLPVAALAGLAVPALFAERADPDDT